tara:strand:- start:104 stop:454 length:351 start_codon:yes stop_codon:yes gene_type:complete
VIRDDLESWTRGDRAAPPHVRDFWEIEDWSTYPGDVPDHWDETEEKWKNADGTDYEGPDQTHFWDPNTGRWLNATSPERFDLELRLAALQHKDSLSAEEIAEAESLAAQIKELEEA